MINARLLNSCLCGLAGNTAPCWARRANAGTHLHRAWSLGHHGFFEKDGVRYGLANPYPAMDA